MGTNEMIGTLIAVGVPLLVSVLALIKPVINLNNSITRLNVTMEQLVGDNTVIKAELAEHEKLLKDHEKRLILVEYKRGREREH